jgi:hypothetical protein
MYRDRLDAPLERFGEVEILTLASGNVVSGSQWEVRSLETVKRSIKVSQNVKNDDQQKMHIRMEIRH